MKLNSKKRFDVCQHFYFCSGEMAERSNAVVLKTIVLQGTGGSNPSFSAEESLNLLLFNRLRLLYFILVSD
jgi:hypothetical protein